MPKNYISNKDETVRIFKKDFLENLSKIHWTVPVFIFLPIIIYFFFNSFFLHRIGYFDIFLYFLAGLVVWSATEYLLHRFVFHLEFKSEFGKRIHFIFHGVHHDYPKDSMRLVMPPSVSIPLATLFYYFFKIIINDVPINPFFAGFLTGYLIYDMVHYAVHHYNTKNRFWLKIKNHHMLHHYQNPDKGFGVSQPFWDYVFRTTFPEKTVKD